MGTAYSTLSRHDKCNKIWSRKIKEGIIDIKMTLMDSSRQDWVQWHVFVNNRHTETLCSKDFFKI